VADEGKNPVWLTLDELKTKDMPVPIRTIVQKYATELVRN